jgi:hypothetical protein
VRTQVVSSDATRWAFQAQRVKGFGFDPELLFLIERGGGKVVEVPVRWNNCPATKVHFLLDSTRMFLDLIALRLRAWAYKYGCQGAENPKTTSAVMVNDQ